MRVSPVASLPYGPPVFYGTLLVIWFLDERRTASQPRREGEIERDEGTRALIHRWGILATAAAIGLAYAVPRATLPIPTPVALFAGVALQWVGYAIVG